MNTTLNKAILGLLILIAPVVLVAQPLATSTTYAGAIQPEPYAPPADNDSTKATEEFKNHLYVGLSIAVTNNEHSGSFRITRDDAPAAVFDNGSAGGSQIGAMIRYRFDERWGVDARVAFDSRPSIFRRDLPVAMIHDPATDSVTEQRVSIHSEVEYRLVTIDLLGTASFKLPYGLSLMAAAGPTLGFVQTGRFTQWQQLDAPAGASFSNPNNRPTEDEGRRMFYAQDEDIPDLNPVRLSIKAGAGGELNLLNLLTLRMGVYYDQPLTDVTRNATWKVSSLMFQFDALLSL